MLRDISERGRDLEQILSQYITFVKPAFEEFCLPVSRLLGLLLNLEVRVSRTHAGPSAEALPSSGSLAALSGPLPGRPRAGQPPAPRAPGVSSSSILPLSPGGLWVPAVEPSRLCSPCLVGSGCGGAPLLEARHLSGQTRPSGLEGLGWSGRVGEPQLPASLPTPLCPQPAAVSVSAPACLPVPSGGAAVPG